MVEICGYPQTLYQKTRFLSIRNIMHRYAFWVSFCDICVSKGVFTANFFGHTKMLASRNLVLARRTQIMAFYCYTSVLAIILMVFM